MEDMVVPRFLACIPQWGTADAEIKHPPLVGSQGYRRFPFSKPVVLVGPNIALHAVPAYKASPSLVPATPAHLRLGLF